MSARRSRESIDIRKIRFSLASAEAESARHPHLLLNGFYDEEGHTSEAIQGSKFLFLGYKGSGKSALGQRLKLMSNGHPDLFVQTIHLGDFPFSQFARIIASTGPTDQEAHFPSVWTWVLLLYLLNSFQRDEGARISDELARAIRSLNEYGSLPTGELKLMVVKSTKTRLRLSLPHLGGGTAERTIEPKDAEALANVETLKDLATTFVSDSRHVLVIDGLDDILTQKNIQFHILAALALAAWRLNDLFPRENVRAKIVLLCRTDLFDRLPFRTKTRFAKTPLSNWIGITILPIQPAVA